jgi:hypothetical protein
VSRAVYTRSPNRAATRLHDVNDETSDGPAGTITYCGEAFRNTARTTVIVLDPAPVVPPGDLEWCGACSTRSPRGRVQARVIADVLDERRRQLFKWGDQRHPDGTGVLASQRRHADEARRACQLAATQGRLTWRHIADEEVAEAYAEDDPGKLYGELIQTAAVFAAWAEDVRRKMAEADALVDERAAP